MPHDSKRKIKILVLAANSDGQTRLELGREFKKISNAIRAGRYRAAFQLLEPQFDVGIGSLSAALLRDRPHVVHFCGHGSASQGLVFVGEDGYSQVAGKRELITLFRELRLQPRLIFLNACHTKDQAKLLSRMFDYTIGTNGLIEDRHAANFAGWFYRTLAEGATVKGAFQSARAEVGEYAVGMSELSPRRGVVDSQPFILQVLGSSNGKRKADEKSVAAKRSHTNTNNLANGDWIKTNVTLQDYASMRDLNIHGSGSKPKDPNPKN
jgi:hypothetical protein